MASLPEELGSLKNINYTLQQRITIEAQYSEVVRGQESDMDEMRKEESFLIPSNVDLSQ